eukprot:1447282-Rhodomonas_salina.2
MVADKEVAKMHYFITIYQHTAQHPDRQRKLLRAVSAITKALRPLATAITISGDLNAAAVRGREGYRTDMNGVDD